jgi:cytidine deaminase
VSQQQQLLLAAAELAREQAYSPYSHYAVGAAVVSAAGKMYAGCNVENASYGLSMCAERTAIFMAVAAGERIIPGLAEVTDAKEPGMPCGACRQVIHEFAASPDIPIVVANTRGEQTAVTFGELLPYPFSLG